MKHPGLFVSLLLMVTFGFVFASGSGWAMFCWVLLVVMWLAFSGYVRL